MLASDNPRLALDKLYTAGNMQCTSSFIASRMVLKVPQVYAYQFSRVRTGPGGKELLAYHGAEIPYIFNTHDDWLPTENVDRSLTELMGSFWVRFAQTGNPNNDDLPYWPAYGRNGSYIGLGDKIIIGQNLNSDICNIMQKRLYKNVIH